MNEHFFSNGEITVTSVARTLCLNEYAPCWDVPILPNKFIGRALIPSEEIERERKIQRAKHALKFDHAKRGKQGRH